MRWHTYLSEEFIPHFTWVNPTSEKVNGVVPYMHQLNAQSEDTTAFVDKSFNVAINFSKLKIVDPLPPPPLKCPVFKQFPCTLMAITFTISLR